MFLFFSFFFLFNGILPSFDYYKFFLLLVGLRRNRSNCHEIKGGKKKKEEEEEGAVGRKSDYGEKWVEKERHQSPPLPPPSGRVGWEVNFLLPPLLFFFLSFFLLAEN